MSRSGVAGRGRHAVDELADRGVDDRHGKLSPRVAIITDVSGIFAFQPTFTYRITDNFLFSATYLAIATQRKTGIGTFRAHDMVQLRATVQLN